MIAAVSRFLPWLVLLLVAATMAACGGTDTAPQDQVRAWLEAIEQAAENKQRGEIMARVSEAYSDGRGNRRKDVENRLRLYFLRADKVALITKIDALDIIDESVAMVTLTVGMAGTDDSLLGISADAYRFELELEADGDEWKLISARWGQLGETLH